MSRLVGRVHFNARMDGDRMPKDAQRLGRESGLAGGKAMSESWDKEFEKTLTGTGKKYLNMWQKRGRANGLAYGAGLENAFRKFSARLNDAFDNFQGLSIESGFLDEFGEKSRDVERDVDRLRGQMELLRDQGAITDAQFRRSTQTIDEWARGNREARIQSEMARIAEQRRGEQMAELSREVSQHARAHQNYLDSLRDGERVHRDYADVVKDNREAERDWFKTMDDLDIKIQKTHRETKSFRNTLITLKKLDPFKGLDNEVRLVIGLIASAADQIAVLGSAVGGGLIALGGTVTSFGVGVLASISVFSNLMQDINKAPAAMRPTIAQFKGLKDTLADVNDTIAQAAFDQMPNTFRILSGTLRALEGPLSEVGRTIGTLLDDLAQNTRPGTEGFRTLSETVRNAVPNFDSMIRSVGTLGLSLLRAFNGAQPLVEDFLGWIDRLVTSFDEFTRSNRLDVWVAQTQNVFQSVGGLLDSVGATLNELSSPAAVQRTTDLLDNLAEFIPVLGGILDVIGTLDPLGLLAEALNEIGEAIEPLIDPMRQVADVLSDDLSVAIGVFAELAGGAVTLIMPFVRVIADLLDALPPGVVAAAAAGMAALSLSMKGLAAASAVAANSASWGTFRGSLAAAVVQIDKATGATGKLNRVMGALGKAGLIGAAVVGFVGLTNVLKDWAREASGVDDQMNELSRSGASLRDIYNQLWVTGDNLAPQLGDLGDTLDRIGSTQGQVWTGARNLFMIWDEQGQVANGLVGVLNEVDTSLEGLPLEAATARFQQLTEGQNLSTAQMIAMLNEMPNLKKQLEDTARASGQLTSDQDLLSMALGESTRESRIAESQADLQRLALNRLQGKSKDVTDATDKLSDAIAGFSEAALNARDSERALEQAIDDARDSIAENTKTLDISTQAGRDNEAALDAIASASLKYAEDILKRTGNEEDATDAITRGRDALIKQLEQFGITGKAAEDYADELGLVPDNISTTVKLLGLDGAENALANLARERWAHVRAVVSGNTVGTRTDQLYASGGILSGPKRIIAGEAGPEAIVPLNRALNQVDPSVRWLSALAQGKGTPAMASGGVVSPGRTVNVAPGAIVVQDSGDSRRAANDVLTRIVEYAYS